MKVHLRSDEGYLLVDNSGLKSEFERDGVHVEVEMDWAEVRDAFTSFKEQAEEALEPAPVSEEAYSAMRKIKIPSLLELSKARDDN